MPHHVVVDGSNLATEGRAMPSLRQLNEAVLAYIEDNPDALITVVVDATFGHRIDPKEVAEFDEAVANNEIVAPPAGAIGRGDAFVLSIANKVGATILTNDSYQEFHGQYAWLFDEGRIVGGKPVPHIGWVFVPRTPVRGPLSRKSMQESKRKGDRASKGGGTVRLGSAEASQPMPVPKAPPPGAVLGRRSRGRGDSKRDAPRTEPAFAEAAAAAHEGAGKAAGTNELLPFLTFVELHPPGSSVSAVVDHYSSHGAYVSLGDVKGYVPLRSMSSPPPRSAREFMKVGEAITLVVESFAPAKRSIDLAVPGMATAKLAEPKAKKAPSRRAAAKTTPAAAPPADHVAAATSSLAEPSAPRPARAARATKKAAAALPAPAEQASPAAAPAAPAAPPAAAAAKPARPSRARKAAAKPAVAEPSAGPAAPIPAEPPAQPTAAARPRGRKAAARDASPVAPAAPAAPTAPTAPTAASEHPAPAAKRGSRRSAAAKEAAPAEPAVPAAAAKHRRGPRP